MGPVLLTIHLSPAPSAARTPRSADERFAGVAGLTVAAGVGPPAQHSVLRADQDTSEPLGSDISPCSARPSPGDLPSARRAASECLVPPLHGGMDHDVVDNICDAIEWHGSTEDGHRS